MFVQKLSLLYKKNTIIKVLYMKNIHINNLQLAVLKKNDDYVKFVI